MRTEKAHPTSGQAVIEYIITLALIISVITIMASGFRRSLNKMWEFYAKQISAPCPGCPPDPNIRF